MMKKPTLPVEPRLEEADLAEETLAELELTSEIDLENLKLSGVATGDASGGRFSQLLFSSARLSAVSWRRAQFEDTLWRNCDLANTDAREVYASRVELVGCRGVGLVSPESNWRDAVFRDGNFSLAQWRFAKFERARFEGCDLREADFQNADLRGVVFRDCDLRGAQFNFARLLNADFRTCQTEEMGIEATALKGLIVSPLQAAQFASILGLKVQWNDGEGL